MSAKDLMTRVPFKLVQLTLDSCSRVFGTSPCLATGTKCFNTYFTCKYYDAYNITPKVYNFISAGIKAEEIIKSIPALYPVRPYIKNCDIRATELSDDKTITSQATIDLYDEPDADIGIDPYREDRGYANIFSVPGTFWKKFIARNPNWLKGTVKIYDGFLGDAELAFAFSGKIKDIKINSDGSVRIECSDILESLNDIKYPVNYGTKLAAAMPAIFTALNETEMLELEAVKDDICLRQDFIKINITVAENGSRVDLNAYVWYDVVAYDAYENPIAHRAYFTNYYWSGNPNKVNLTWGAITGATHYKIFRKISPGTGSVNYGDEELKGDTTGTSYNDDISVSGTPGVPPSAATRFYQLQTDDPTLAANWLSIAASLSISLDDSSILASVGAASGYLRIDKEIIYYSGISGNTLTGVIRGLYDSNTDAHALNADVGIIVKKSPGNPFTYLKDLLTLAKIPAANISSRFDTYESGWTGISFSILEVVKDMKLADIYFDLVNALDCYSWVNENGEIDIKFKSDLTVAKNISDEYNIIKDSVSVELKDDKRITRVIYYWDRDVRDEALDEPQAYSRGTQSKDISFETAAFGEISEKEIFSAWVNKAGNDLTSVRTYILGVAEAILNRLKSAPNQITFSLEIKDMDIITADIISLSTNKFQDIYGAPYSGVLFRVIKRERDGINKIKLTLEKVNA
jgi:hypothetical protein